MTPLIFSKAEIFLPKTRDFAIVNRRELIRHVLIIVVLISMIAIIWIVMSQTARAAHNPPLSDFYAFAVEDTADINITWRNMTLPPFKVDEVRLIRWFNGTMPSDLVTIKSWTWGKPPWFPENGSYIDYDNASHPWKKTYQLEKNSL